MESGFILGASRSHSERCRRRVPLAAMGGTTGDGLEAETWQGLNKCTQEMGENQESLNTVFCVEQIHHRRVELIYSGSDSQKNAYRKILN